MGSLQKSLTGCRRFLFLQYETALGAAVLTTPMFQALRESIPDAQITVAGAGLPLQMLRSHPAVNECIVTPHALRSFPKALAFFLQKIRPRRREFDCVITDGGNRRTKIALLGLASGIRYRIGMTVRPELYCASIPYDESIGVLENNLRVLELLGVRTTVREPRIYCVPEEGEAAEKLLAKHGVDRERPVIAFVAQTSGGHPNQWFDVRFVEVAEEIHRKYEAQILFVGTKAETPKIQELQARVGFKTFSLAGETDIPTLAAVFAVCDGVLTVDTGSMHVARAVGVPTVVLGHSANPRYEWLPKANERLMVIRHEEVPCAFCRKNFCATRECMQEITVAEAVEAIDRLWKQFPPSPRERAARLESMTCQKEAAYGS